MLTIIMCDLILEFRFYQVTDQTFVSATAYAAFYSAYRLLFTITAFAVESLLVPRLIARLGLRNAFLILPLCALTGGLWMLAMPGMASAVGGMTLQKLPQSTVDETARKDLLTLVPAERRGRVAILIESYMYAAGSILGSIVLGLIVLVQSRLGQSESTWAAALWVAVAGALVSLGSILQARRMYETTLLGGFLRRRRRTASVLDRLE
jgi:MFS family permease